MGGYSASSGGGGKSSLIWKWNETNTSQFQIAHDGIGSAALSVQTKNWGPALRVTWPTKADGQLATFITITDTKLINALAKDANNLSRYELRFRCCGFSGTAAEWYALGPAFACNTLTGVNFYGLAFGAKVATATRAMRVEGGTLTLSGGTPNWVEVATAVLPPNSQFESTIAIRHPAASPPGFFNTLMHISKGMTGNDVPNFAMDDAYWVSQVGAFGAGWNTATLNTCGIAVLGTTGQTAGQYWEFDSICVVRHPMTL